MVKVLIATIYSPDPVLLSTTQIGPDKLILLLDETNKKKQEGSYNLIKGSVGRVVKVSKVNTETYDIVKVAEKCVKIIDEQNTDDEIYINITSGRKTKALGLLFASYARIKRIKNISYNPEEEKNSIVWLPKLSFKLTESQKKVLEILSYDKNSELSFIKLAEKVGISRAMLYRNIDELKDSGFISEDNSLTDAGRIARL